MRKKKIFEMKCIVARGCIVKNGGKCTRGKSRIVEKAVLWKSEKYAKKIWHAGVNKNTPPFR